MICMFIIYSFISVQKLRFTYILLLLRIAQHCVSIQRPISAATVGTCRLQNGGRVQLQPTFDFEISIAASSEMRKPRSAFLQLLVSAPYHEPVDVYRYGYYDFSRSAAADNAIWTFRSATRRVPAAVAFLAVVAACVSGQQTGLDPFPFRSPVLKPYLHLWKWHTRDKKQLWTTEQATIL